jgi:hypothetical protein
MRDFPRPPSERSLPRKATNRDLRSASTNNLTAASTAALSVQVPLRCMASRMKAIIDFNADAHGRLIRQNHSSNHHFFSSATHLEIAVASFRGAIRTDSASSKFLNPDIVSVFPFISARYPSRATVFASIGPNC